MNYTRLNGFLDIVKAAMTPPAVSIGIGASKVIATGIIDAKGSSGMSTVSAPMMPMKTTYPKTTAPTVPQGQTWTNYQLTGSAATKPTLDTILPKYNIAPTISTIKQPTIRYDSNSLNLSQFITPIPTQQAEKPNYLKTFLPYIAIGGVGLVTLFALKG